MDVADTVLEDFEAARQNLKLACRHLVEALNEAQDPSFDEMVERQVSRLRGPLAELAALTKD